MTTTILVKLTSDFRSYNGSTVSIQIDSKYASLFNENVLLYQKNQFELHIIRDCQGNYVRRAVNKMNPNPGCYGGISLPSYLFGKVNMRRMEGSHSKQSKSVNFKYSAFVAHTGRYTAYSTFVTLHEDNTNPVKTFFHEEMVNDVKYINAIRKVTKESSSDVLHPSDRIFGDHANLQVATIPVLYRPNNAIITMNISINRLFHTRIENMNCEYMINPSICNEIMITKNHKGQIVCTGALPGVPLTQYMYGANLKRILPLNYKSKAQSYELMCYTPMSKKQFSEKVVSHYVYSDSTKHSQYYVDVPAAVNVSQKIEQRPEQIAKPEPKIEPVIATPLPNTTNLVTLGHGINVTMPDGMQLSGSVNDIASLIVLLRSK